MKNLARHLILTLGLTQSVFADSCPQIDLTKKDTDGMPFCPAEVNGPNSVWVLYTCAIRQTTNFHAPTPNEKSAMTDLLGTYKKVTESGIAADTTAKLLQDASVLDLQVCRIAQVKNNAPDSVLVFYVKPGVTTYSGPFMMLRETKHSKVVIIGPHDDSDGTYADTKLALVDSTALATISNGHMRGNIKNQAPGGKNGDFVHEPLADNLGTFVVDRLTALFQGSVVLHIHGMSDDKKVLVRSRNTQLQAAFEKAVTGHTIINTFAPLNADFTIESYVHTDFYLKTEMPAKIHESNKLALSNIVQDIETYSWAK